ncbi:GAF domain-containing protein [Pedobacter nyackensis]|uniref:GAF domain-containing protein n=1 Tax=Pedobacter nyackensis TaxID=475255 RepID=A0A1W2C6I4_9SPHI|nr:GAF domain-containing protein [Pedobacter nyackensis]SMC80716.1 hypothetical protein SAMN04488101_103184 [Pedobacter nyackensis]
MENKIRRSIALDGKSNLYIIKGYRILNTKPVRAFDELAVLTATVFNTSIALINFVDQDHDLTRNVCSVAIIKENQRLLEALSTTPILISNAMIAGEMGMKFFASIPITNEEGFDIGMICIADEKSRVFTPQDKVKLERIGTLVRKEMDKRNCQTDICLAKD